MARPIKYIPQVIPTDFGNLAIQAMQNRQNQYDTAFSGAMQAEDQFGQLVVDPSDIEGKNTILGGFKDRAKQIVDKYGGDYGAAAKELASEITKTRANPFFQVAEFKRTMAEEERRKKESLGTNAIVVKSISNTPVLGADGRVVSKDQLESKIYDKRQLMQDLAIKYGNIANQQRDESVEYKIPGYATKVIRTGLLPEEVAPKIEEAVSQLRASYGDIPEETLRQIASEYIPSLVGGRKTQELADNRLSMEGQSIQNKIGRLTLQMKQKELDALNNKGNVDPNLIPGIPDTSTFDINDKKSRLEHNERVANFNKVANSIPEIKARIAKSKASISDINNRISKIDKSSPYPAQTIAQLKGGLSTIKKAIADNAKKLESARKQYVESEKSFGPMLQDLKSQYGMSTKSAIDFMTKQNPITTGRFNTISRTTVGNTESLSNLLNKNATGFYEEILDKHDKRTFEDKEFNKLSQYLGSNEKGTKQGKINNYGFDLSNRTIELSVTTPSGNNTTLHVPSSSIQSAPFKRIWDRFSAVEDATSGKHGLGTTIVMPNGEVKHYKHNESIPDISIIPNDSYIVTNGVGNGNKYEYDVQVVHNGRVYTKPLSSLAEQANSDLEKALNVKTTVEARKVNINQ